MVGELRSYILPIRITIIIKQNVSLYWGRQSGYSRGELLRLCS